MYDEKKRVAVVGVGNILMGDEGVGVHVIEELKESELRRGIELIDAGTSFFSVVSDLVDIDKLIIVDAARGGGEPGAIYRFEIDDIETMKAPHLSLHDIGIYETLQLERLVRDMPKEIVFFGIEPQSIELSTDISSILKKKMRWLVKKIVEECE